VSVQASGQVAEGDAILSIRNWGPGCLRHSKGGHAYTCNKVPFLYTSLKYTQYAQCTLGHGSVQTVAAHAAHSTQQACHGVKRATQGPPSPGVPSWHAKGTSLATRRWLWMDLERATEVQCQAGPAWPYIKVSSSPSSRRMIGAP
jgi:hypothetical protein